MWKCPVCLRENQEPVCPGCGFDGSCDYEHYPTAASLKDAPASIARQRRRYQDSLKIQSCPACGSKQFFLKDSSPICAQCGHALAPVRPKQDAVTTGKSFSKKQKAGGSSLKKLLRPAKVKLIIIGVAVALIAIVSSFAFGKKSPSSEPAVADGDSVNVQLVNTVADSTHAYHVTTLGLFERWSGTDALDLYNQSGEKGELTGSYKSAAPLGQGLLKLRLKSEDENTKVRFALADCSGKLLIPEAECFGWITGTVHAGIDIWQGTEDDLTYQEAARYLLVKTENGCQFYDTKCRTIIDGFIIDDMSASFAVCGDSLVVLYEDDTAELYDEKGNLLASFDRHPEIGDAYLLVNYSTYEQGLCKLYDQSGKLIRELERDLAPIEGTGGYLKDLKYRDRGVYDFKGTEILPEKYYDILWNYRGTFLVRKEDANDTKYGLIRSDGTWVSDSAYSSCDVVWKDYCLGYDLSSHKRILMNSRGLVVKIGFSGEKDCLIWHDNEKLFVLNSGAYVLPCSQVEALTYGLAACKMENEDGYRIVDAFRGEVLTELVYEEVLYSNGFVFGYSDGFWYVYSVSYPDSESQAVENDAEPIDNTERA